MSIEDKVTILQINSPYPLKMAGNDGASCQFLLKDLGSVIQVCVPDLQKIEIEALREGDVRAGFLYADGDIIFLIRIYDTDKKEVFTFDCPFDARLISRENLDLQNIDNPEQRLLIQLHAIDTATGILKAIRAFTMPPELTMAFLSAVQLQLCLPKNHSILKKWLSVSVDDLFKQCKTYKLGT